MEDGYTWGLESDTMDAVKSVSGILPSEKKFLSRIKQQLPELNDKAWNEFKQIAREENTRRKMN